MSLRSLLRRGSSKRRNVLPLLAAAIAACGLAAWRIRQASPTQQRIDAGIELMQSKKPEDAEREWREAVRLEPSNAQAWQLLGDYYKAAQLWPSARDAYEHVAQAAPETPGVQASLAECALKANDLDSAQRYGELAVQRAADDIVALKVLAAVAWERENDDKQLELLRRVAGLSPQDPQALGALAEALTAKNEYSQARPIVEQILKLQPENALAHRLRGVARMDEDPTPGGLTAAKADLQKALQLNPEDVESHRYLGRVYMRLNEPRHAIEHFEAVGRDRPYASAHFMELAGAYRKAGDERAAESWARRFSAVERFNMRMRDLRDRITRKAAKFDNSLELGLLLLDGVQNSSDAFHLFQFRYRKGQIETVDFYLAQALQLRPRDARAQAAARRLEAVYVRYLQAAGQAVQRRDTESAAENIAHAILLRPQDPRTLNATRYIMQ